jgi:hypothetical protein
LNILAFFFVSKEAEYLKNTLYIYGKMKSEGGVKCMGIIEKTSLKGKIVVGIVVLVILMSINSYIFLFKPKNSLELYQSISFADDFEEAKKLMLKGYEGNFKEEDFEFMKRLDTNAKSIGQFTLFEFDDKTFVIMTSPGTQRLKVIAVEELPIEIREYFLGLSPL